MCALTPGRLPMASFRFGSLNRLNNMGNRKGPMGDYGQAIDNRQLPDRLADCLIQQPSCGKADHAADDRCGEEGQQVIRQPVLRRPCAAGECPRVALDVGLTLHEREDLAVGH